MTTHVRNHVTTVPAGQDLNADSVMYKAATLAGTICDAAPATAIGIIVAKANSGYPLTIAYEGEVKIQASAAVNSGARLTVTASGWFGPAAAGSYGIGRALEGASSGSLFRALVNFVNYV